jgi:hypothetical protein
MKKNFTFLLAMLCLMSYSQQKSTSVVPFIPGLSAELKLDNSTSLVTLTINGPSDRWFAVTFGSFGNPGAMNAGNDLVYYNGTLIDATHNGQGNTPIPDTVNNWTFVKDDVVAGTRTIVYTRPFVAEATDYTFNFSDTTVSLAGARAATAILTTLQDHGINRFNAGSKSLTILGLEDFSLNGSAVYPNPSKGNFTVKTKTVLNKINVYSQSGAFVKTIEVNDNSDNVEINIEGLQSGIYLIELQNEEEKSWKKVIIN